MDENAEGWQGVFAKANHMAQRNCAECRAGQHGLMCTFHRGWANGFETAVELFKLAEVVKAAEEDAELG